MLDVHGVLAGIEGYLKSDLGVRLADAGLAPIAQWDIGYRDILSGLREHPAIVIKSDSDAEDSESPYFQNIDVDVALVIANQDGEAGYQQLCAYQGAIDAALNADPSLGDTVSMATGASFDKASVDGVYILMCSFMIKVIKE